MASERQNKKEGRAEQAHGEGRRGAAFAVTISVAAAPHAGR